MVGFFKNIFKLKGINVGVCVCVCVCVCVLNV